MSIKSILSKVLTVTSILLLLSCSPENTNQKHISQNSSTQVSDVGESGMEKITKLYGGQSNYSVGRAVGSDGIAKYIKVEIKGSPVIEKYAHVIEMPASNIAYLFYNELGQEANKYQEIQVAVTFSDNTEQTFTYSRENLDLINNKMRIAEKIISYIRDRNFTAIEPMLNSETSDKYRKEGIAEKMSTVDGQFGKVSGYEPYGFRINEIGDGARIVHLSYIIFRERQNQAFSIDVSADRNNDEVYFLQYEF